MISTMEFEQVFWCNMVQRHAEHHGFEDVVLAQISKKWSVSLMIIMWSEDSQEWPLEDGSQVLGNPKDEDVTSR